MPFRTLGDETLEYTPNLPEALVVAVLDHDIEREGRTTAVLVHSFLYQHPASGAEIVVPENFITDFASIPAAVRFAIPPFGRHAKAAVLHDWIYAIGEPGKRAFADRIFKDAMKELNVDSERRKVMYQAVHLFGEAGYERAAQDWPESWGDWRKGVRVAPAKAREDFFMSKWRKPPRANYSPD